MLLRLRIYLQSLIVVFGLNHVLPVSAYELDPKVRQGSPFNATHRFRPWVRTASFGVQLLLAWTLA